jgi:hypothetical protein
VNADPALKRGRLSRSGRTRRGSASKPITSSTDRVTGVVSTACQEGSLRSVGEARGGRGVANLKRPQQEDGPSGRRIGSWYLRSRVMPVEGRTLASGVLEKEERSGDWR